MFSVVRGVHGRRIVGVAVVVYAKFRDITYNFGIDTLTVAIGGAAGTSLFLGVSVASAWTGCIYQSSPV